MGHQWIRINLAATSYPLTTDLWGRTIIVPQYDENYVKSIISPQDLSKDKGQPQAFYMQDCMPTAQGYQAVGYDLVIDPIAQTDFDAAFPVQNSSLDKFIFSPASGKNYIFDRELGVWTSVSPISPGALKANALVTTAFVQLQTYIFYENFNCYKYNQTTKALDVVVLGGVTVTDIKGICAPANGYMIAWDDTTLIWSSRTNPTDFVVSLVTGAGGGVPNDINGKIVCCLPVSGGFIIYCENNAVAATYTGNANFPYAFKEIPGSGGISGPEQVTWQSNLDYHYAWTTEGLQQLSISGAANNAFPDITEFLSGLVFEEFDIPTVIFTQTDLTQAVAVKLAMCGGSYLVISYGRFAPDYEYAIIYDIKLGRFGKVKIAHRDCFNWNAPNFYASVSYGQIPGAFPPGLYSNLTGFSYLDFILSPNFKQQTNKTLAFLQKDGTVKILNFNMSERNDAGELANGVLLVGKFELTRNKFITGHLYDVENVRQGDQFSMYILPTLDGKTFLPAVVPNINMIGPKTRRYGRQITGQNLSLVFIGAFNLTSALMDFEQAGDR